MNPYKYSPTKFTELQRSFVIHYLATKSPVLAAKLAGYASYKVMAETNMKLQHVLDAIEAGGVDRVAGLAHAHLSDEEYREYLQGVRDEAKQEYVYLIGSEVGRTKIGVSNNPDARLNSMQTGSPVKLHLIVSLKCEYAYNVECALHGRFGSKNYHYEWFDLSEEDVQWIVSHYKALDIPLGIKAA